MNRLEAGLYRQDVAPPYCLPREEVCESKDASKKAKPRTEVYEHVWKESRTSI